MKHGLAIFATDEGLPPAELARLVEARGFESLWFPEHTHIPASRASEAPRGGELPREYLRTLDPFVALSAAASATTELRVGTGICLIVERDPITTAKSVATLDHISGGRFLFGVGAGWNLEEMRNHGTDPDRRFALMGDRVRAMKQIWTEDEAAYEGRFVNFGPIWAWPKPTQRPHPPVLIAGNGPTAIKRVLGYGDEWLPEPEEGLVDRIAELPERAREVGRDQVPVTVYGADPGDVDAYATAGVHRCV
ncbi:MAG: LLM class F420-dependent oxidoreductase, partial [Solirubrobacterales bacterium]